MRDENNVRTTFIHGTELLMTSHLQNNTPQSYQYQSAQSQNHAIETEQGEEIKNGES